MLAAAADLVLIDGVHGFSIDEVARRSGVAKTTIYRHFPTRNELLIAAIDAATAVPKVPDTGSLRRDLLEFLAEILPIFADATLRAATFDVIAAAIRDPELRQIYMSMMGARLGALQSIYRRAVERGEIPATVDYQTAFEVIEGPFIVRAMTRPEGLADIDLDALVDRIIRILNI